MKMNYLYTTLVSIAILLAGCINHPTQVYQQKDSRKFVEPLKGALATDNLTYIIPSGKFESSFAKIDYTKETIQKPNIETAPNAKNNYSWGPGKIYIKATTTKIHFNLNQPARLYDSNADEWSLVLSANAPFGDKDKLYFCGLDSSIHIQVYDHLKDTIIFDDNITGVEACN